MARSEWPLVGFTLLLQAALGLVLAAASAPLLVADATLVVRWSLLTAVPALAVGMLLSLGHLGSPRGAYRAIRNIGTSWLSREIATSLLFSLLTAASLVADLTSHVSLPLLWFTALAGSAAVGAMSGVYLRTIKPAWQTFFTPLSFFATACLVGALAFIAAEPALALNMIIPTLGAELIGLWLYQRKLEAGPTAARLSWQLLTETYGRLLAARRLLWTGGLLAIGVGLSRGWPGLLLLAVGLLLTSEVLGRVLFFAVGVPTSVGQ
ncbi:MAG: dimethyl sulfoxide reductase anchor subunit family protein [Mycobacterium leprae]